ncbi:MAG: hypothetical protein IKN86_05485 [Bacteroidaceae bacterium]|jgi:hypothetical protein|nr:hypothetical protein [Bacteroidaceae bacterium]MBR3546999.1 hypothetical protein [Bacteroidaceae bacterium]MBR4527633.1 hypothetical protein [Bacteroidaceae bacterium]MBR6047707.1 hypothetical protein [Bacteroidaceae bacterium]
MKEFGETCVYTCRKQVRVVALIIGLISICAMIFLCFTGASPLTLALIFVILLLGNAFVVFMTLRTQNDFIELNSRGMTGYVHDKWFRGFEINCPWSDYEKIQVSSFQNSGVVRIKYSSNSRSNIMVMELTQPNGDVQKITSSSIIIKQEELVEAINHYSGRPLASSKPMTTSSKVGLIIFIILDVIVLLALLLKVNRFFG